MISNFELPRIGCKYLPAGRVTVVAVVLGVAIVVEI